MKKWLIYWIAENEDSLFILSFLLALTGVGCLGFEQEILGIIFLVLFVIVLNGISYCVEYKLRKTKNINDTIK